jgi:hypothetical protein
VAALSQAPYFFVRTTLSVLLSLVKTAKGAPQEHAIGNFIALLPTLWERLRQQERWQVGQSYAEVNAAGDRAASSGLKKALLSVHGFDFVPETLRSSTFSRTAARVLEAHFGYNNFANETEPMETLAALGTAVPQPAFGKCMEATLAVWLGNRWGVSWAANVPAKRLLDSLRNEQWEYYLNENLPGDRTILDKISVDDKPVARWTELVKTFNLTERVIRDAAVTKLLEVSARSERDKIKTLAQKLRAKARA